MEIRGKTDASEQTGTITIDAGHWTGVRPLEGLGKIPAGASTPLFNQRTLIALIGGVFPRARAREKLRERAKQ